MHFGELLSSIFKNIVSVAENAQEIKLIEIINYHFSSF